MGFVAQGAHLTYGGYLTIEILTDTADPRRVPEAFPIMSLKYDEAMELAYFGAQVYPGTSHSRAGRILPPLLY
jgi:bifunctional aspartokinase / homoserine dehydrogenase 1